MGAVAAACASLTPPVAAQRVQFPTAAPGVTPYAATTPPPLYPTYPTTPQPTLTPSIQPSLPATMPSFDPYATPGLGTPPADVPYTAPTLTPNFGSPVPAGAPGYGIPYAEQPSQGNVMQNMPSVQWNRGTYDQTNPDGSVAKLQRFLQQISVESTYLFGNHSANDLAWNRLEMAATFGVPIFKNPDTPLLITPGFAFNWLEGPSGPDADLPPRLYDAYLDTAWSPQLNDWLSADLGFRTGVWSDFEFFDSHSMRFMGRGLGVVKLSPKMDAHVGVWYIDRNKYKLLPAGGVFWRPNAEWDAWLIFPNPKVRKRFRNDGASQMWWYVAGEYGGGSWTILRSQDGPAAGAEDNIDINDIRVSLGFEWETQTRLHGHFEVGYVFDREIVYAQTNLPPTYSLDDTVMLRLGVDF